MISASWSSLAPPDARARLAETSGSAAAARKGQSDGWRTRINNGPSGKRGELPSENPDLTSGLPRLRKGDPGVGHRASVPRSPRWGSEALRLDSVSYCFGPASRGQLLILPFKLTLRRVRRRSEESGGPPLFELSLKVQGDNTHNNSGFSVIPRLSHQQLPGGVWMAMGTSVFRIRTTVDFPPVLKSDHTMRSCSASLRAGRPYSSSSPRSLRGQN